ncbi:hypothetical protein A3K74_01690 [Candidatus Pacearchaeota archaeon RBG_13_33_26]|nr:MAG: hypothetical protein A3K74_01690 [Candidatus Pacearchaeota archaeon RBG_13_33_26]
MPGQDKTGPAGYGPLTGRGLGPCGCRMRRGFGRGYEKGFGRYNIPITLTKEEEKKILEAEIKDIDLEKQEIAERLKELK